MSKFNYIKEQQPTAATVKEYEILRINVNGHSPILSVVPATEVNKPYFNAVVKSANKIAKRVRAGAITTDLIDQNRTDDKKLYADHIIVGWENVFDGKGKKVTFSKEDCHDLLEALPSDIFDELRAFCSDINNFTQPVDLEAAAKN